MKLVILDRDGVINYDSAAFIKTPEEWRPIPGSLDAIARLTQMGYRVVVATNQSGIARGLLDMAGLNAINDKMSKAASHAGGRIDAMFFCPHANADQCDCRKPATGMFKQIANRFDIELGTVPAIGDSLRDMEAASAAGAIPVLVLTGQGKKTSKESALPENTKIFPDLATAVDALIK